MARAADRELRKELLLKAFDKFADLDKAFDAATRMEHFVLGVGPARGTQDAGFSTEATPPSGTLETLAPHPAVEDSRPKGRTPSSRRRWRDNDDAQLRLLCDQGYTVREIAMELERTPASVYGRMNQYGLKATSRPRGQRRSKLSKVSQTADENNTDSVNIRASIKSSSEQQVRRRKSAKESSDSVAIEEVIHFLKTRDYSVVCTEDGHFKVDGRQIVTALELFHRANRVRQSLGKRPWAALHEIPHADKVRSDRDHQNSINNGLSKGKR